MFWEEKVIPQNVYYPLTKYWQELFGIKNSSAVEKENLPKLRGTEIRNQISIGGNFIHLLLWAVGGKETPHEIKQARPTGKVMKFKPPPRHLSVAIPAVQTFVITYRPVLHST
jgi:hypothetical protein